MDDEHQALREWWRTGVSRVEPNVIELRGYPVGELIGWDGSRDPQPARRPRPLTERHPAGRPRSPREGQEVTPPQQGRSASPVVL
ncbi:hypothetical protein ITP53_34600 [Nonomuraea sp. K274]|uniref:Uncharacterized protein n=1 Tax=Nonomuraea cypriaca TaxID=1187855 RepID=A0A931AD33_9ACTN|nr:hypothetical protein [Nonomuraea cypriaca]MBF8190752.1 hypothetical protein [Nonomuraea cypriaca]